MPSALELFGRQVKQLRIARGLSQEALAEKCGVHRNYIGTLERSEKHPGFVHVLKLAMGLKVRPAELFKLIPQPTHADIPQARKNKKEK